MSRVDGTMPTAAELRELCHIDVFIEDVVSSALRSARVGEVYHVVDVPVSIPMPLAKAELIKAFPGCKITKRWFTRYYEVRWT